MIAGTFHNGSGLGNQLHRYVAVRTLAEDKGFEWGMENPENFKGDFFKDFDCGEDVSGITNTFQEERINNKDGVDVRTYDERILDVKDNTILDGEFQDERYFEHRLDDIREWLYYEPIPFNMHFVSRDNICIINFRGGEYVGAEDLFLPQSYWNDAMEKMKRVNPSVRFGVVTDDITTAQKFFPNFDIRHDMHADWSAINTARYVILSNSSFGILPALLNQNAQKIIAPKYWAGYNVGYWKLPQNEYKRFTYI